MSLSYFQNKFINYVYTCWLCSIYIWDRALVYIAQLISDIIRCGNIFGVEFHHPTQQWRTVSALERTVAKLFKLFKTVNSIKPFNFHLSRNRSLTTKEAVPHFHYSIRHCNKLVRTVNIVSIPHNYRLQYRNSRTIHMKLNISCCRRHNMMCFCCKCNESEHD